MRGLHHLLTATQASVRHRDTKMAQASGEFRGCGARTSLSLNQGKSYLNAKKRNQVLSSDKQHMVTRLVTASTSDERRARSGAARVSEHKPSGEGG